MQHEALQRTDSERQWQLLLPVVLAGGKNLDKANARERVRMQAHTAQQLSQYSQDVDHVQLEANRFFERITRNPTGFCHLSIVKDLLGAAKNMSDIVDIESKKFETYS